MALFGLTSAPARAQSQSDSQPELIWRAPTFSAADYAITGVAAAITGVAAIVPPRKQHSLSGPVGFDLEVRRALRGSSLNTRYAFRDASDVGVVLMLSYPFLGDALTTAAWHRQSPEVATQMTLIDLEAFAITGALQGTANVLMSRERPYGRDCGGSQLPGDATDCTAAFHYRSFFSGHSSFSFTSAALICAHHFEHELLGGPWDALTCAGGYAVAATTAGFRVVADVHYPTDVLIGATVGTLVGWGVPLFHYRKLGGERRRRDASDSELEWSVVPSGNGLGVVGVF